MKAMRLAISLSDAINAMAGGAPRNTSARYAVHQTKWISFAGRAALEAGVTTTRAEDEAQVAALEAEGEAMQQKMCLICARADPQVAEAEDGQRQAVAKSMLLGQGRGSFLDVCTGTALIDPVDEANAALAIVKSLADAERRDADAAMQAALDAQVQATKTMDARAEARDYMAFEAQKSARVAQTNAARYDARDADRAHSRMVARELCKTKRWLARPTREMNLAKWLARKVKAEEKALEMPTAAHLDHPSIIAAIVLLREDAEKEEVKEAAAKAKRVQAGPPLVVVVVAPCPCSPLQPRRQRSTPGVRA